MFIFFLAPALAAPGGGALPVPVEQALPASNPELRPVSGVGRDCSWREYILVPR